jgi:hypothetical protein
VLSSTLAHTLLGPRVNTGAESLDIDGSLVVPEYKRGVGRVLEGWCGAHGARAKRLNGCVLVWFGLV